MKTCYQVLFLTLSLCLFSCKKTDDRAKQTITIGGLLSLSGNWSSLGNASQEAIKLALADVNAHFQQNGTPYEFNAQMYDTKLDTSLALQSIKDAQAKKISYFIGPQSSAEVATIKSFANTNNLLIVSQGSTASNLAIANDAIFRFCPGDAIEGAAMALTLRSLGYQHLITIARDDAGNKGLQQSVGSVFSTLGGTTDALTAYSASQTDFTALLATLKIRLQAAIATQGTAKVGVYLASFDECVKLFQQATTDPVFSSVRWFGGDGVVLSAALTSNTAAASFAAATQFFAPNFGLPLVAHPDLMRVAAAIKLKTGIEPDAYALSAYDATWVIAMTVASFPSAPSDFQKFLPVFKTECNHYYGITGPLQLNDAGDRSNGSFDYWGVALVNGIYQWKWVGKSL